MKVLIFLLYFLDYDYFDEIWQYKYTLNTQLQL